MMMSFIRPRWRKPAWTILAGAVLTAAWAIRGGPHWWLWASLTAIAAAARALAFFVWGGQDNDEGALAGSRADERQKLISLQSRALACNVTAVTAFIGLTVAVAARGDWWWPFAVVLAITVYGYLFGLSTYRTGEEDPADDTSLPHQPPSAVSH